MSDWINKTFRNTATTTMIVSVAAHVAGLIKLDDEVTDILATGAVAPNSDDERAEQARMHKWIRQTFIGKPASHFHAHDGIVPDAIRVASRDLKTVEDCKARFGNTTNFGSPYITLAESYTGMKYVPARRAPMRILKPLYFKHPANIGKTNYTCEFLNAVKHSGHELPPQAGECYFSVVTGNTYTVVDVARKLHHETDYYVTMERDGDKHRTKFTYRNHTEWLTTWRPVDDEGKARKTVQVDVMHEAAEENRRYFAAFEDSAVYDLIRIGNELDKRLPNWKELPSTPPGRFSAYTMLDLMIRALRTLARQRDNTTESLRNVLKENEALKEQNKMQLAMAEVRNKEIAKLKQERGGSWGPERIKTEQSRMYAMLEEYCMLFKHSFGIERLRVHVDAFGMKMLRDLPLEKYVDFMKDCRAYADKQRT